MFLPVGSTPAPSLSRSPPASGGTHSPLSVRRSPETSSSLRSNRDLRSKSRRRSCHSDTHTERPEDLKCDSNVH